MGLGCPVSGTQRFCGEIVRVAPMEPYGPGRIPDFNVRVRGRLGKEVDFSFVALHGQIHETWDEAIALCKPPKPKAKPRAR